MSMRLALSREKRNVAYINNNVDRKAQKKSKSVRLSAYQRVLLVLANFYVHLCMH